MDFLLNNWGVITSGIVLLFLGVRTFTRLTKNKTDDKYMKQIGDFLRKLGLKIKK